ncbi:MAG: Transcriptional regulator, PaaX family [Candidatus Giovannonibacteria bacterium GW2011_GWA2_44_26]|uniref:Transcriptional regulator, PaaX family n=1 Tax=Candidatus Giovannonibacteria bacterium GW2011_GWA2_44_26 TaxID=1618648 RepID=A0A0G1IPM5_9BACT|nr:MAG: Transcriptional regulator, PaaX family [Candidatus Giovannonibacteria bacterium GW2011_GWA2_44_26]
MRKLDSLGPISRKILLLLLGGVALSFSRSPRQYFKILKDIKKDWRAIDRRKLHYSINKLSKTKFVKILEKGDGFASLTLTNKGKIKAFSYKIEEVAIPRMAKWDGKWRFILFDIPEQRRKARNALARVLKRMGFYQFQKSVFMHPFECRVEIDFVSNFFGVSACVSFIVAEKIDNESKFRAYFEV